MFFVEDVLYRLYSLSIELSRTVVSSTATMASRPHSSSSREDCIDHFPLGKYKTKYMHFYLQTQDVHIMYTHAD